MCENLNFDIIGISETRKFEQNLSKRKNGNYLLMGQAKNGFRGTGFYIHKKWTSKIKEFKSASDRISVLKLEIENKTIICLIQVYAPTNMADTKEKEEFYTILNRTLAEEKGYYNIIMGDFNAKIDKTGNWESVGMFSSGNKTNDNGERMLDFSVENWLKIANTFYKKKLSKKWTWQSPDRCTKNEIDYFLVNNMSIVKDVGINNKITFPSDHRAIQIKIEIQNRCKTKNWVKNNRRAHGTELPLNRITFWKEKVKKELSKLEINLNSNTANSYEAFVNIISNIGMNEFITPKNSPNDKLTDNTKNLIQKRKELIEKTGKLDKTEVIELTELRKLIKKSIREDIRNYDTARIAEILEDSRSFKKAKKELYPHKPLISGFRNKKGLLTQDREVIVKTATDFYRDLYAARKTTNARVKETPPYNMDQVPPILETETFTTLKQLKCGKAEGPDGISNYILKTFAEEITPKLTELFNMITETETIPKQWKIAELILLYKKGNREEIKNYRPISLTSNICKVYTKILKNRMYNYLDNAQSPEQAGFRRNYSTIDHLFTVNQLIEKTNEYRINAYILFIDFEKAFDIVNLEYLWNALARQGIPQKFIKIIQEMYTGTEAYIRLDKKGPKFKLERGVKQGDPLSPNLFNAVIEEIFWELGWENVGIKINGRYLNNLRFADDLVLFAQDIDTLQAMALELENTSSKAGLIINAKKTVLISNAQGKCSLNLNGEIVPLSEETTYLGQIVSFHDRLDKEISSRIAKAWKGFWSMKAIYKTKIPTKLKATLLESCTYPILTYGSQT